MESTCACEPMMRWVLVKASPLASSEDHATLEVSPEHETVASVALVSL